MEDKECCFRLNTRTEGQTNQEIKCLCPFPCHFRLSLMFPKRVSNDSPPVSTPEHRDHGHSLLYWVLCTTAASQAGPGPTGHTFQLPMHHYKSTPHTRSEQKQCNVMPSTTLHSQKLSCAIWALVIIVQVYEMYENKTSWSCYSILRGRKRSLVQWCYNPMLCCCV